MIMAGLDSDIRQDRQLTNEFCVSHTSGQCEFHSPDMLRREVYHFVNVEIFAPSQLLFA
jgi:hypothetical protein